MSVWLKNGNEYCQTLGTASYNYRGGYAECGGISFAVKLIVGLCNVLSINDTQFITQQNE